MRSHDGLAFGQSASGICQLGGSVRVEVYAICNTSIQELEGGGSTGGQPQTGSGGRRDGERGPILGWTHSAANRIMEIGFTPHRIQLQTRSTAAHGSPPERAHP